MRSVADETHEIELLVAELAERIGPRRPTSAEEARAAALVNGRLRRAGMGVSAYELRVVPRAGAVYAVYAALGIAGVGLAFFAPWLALLWGAGLLAIALTDAFVAPLPPLGRRRVSQNIVGTRAVAEAARTPPVQPRWRVVLLAPLDTPPLRRGITVLAGTARSGVLVRLAAAVLLAGGALGAALLPGPWWLLHGSAGLLFGLILIGATRPCVPDPSDGGRAALAALVATATRLEALARAEVWAVAVGAASSDPWGVISLLRRYPFERERTLVIALDALSVGQLVYATAEGALRSQATDPLLVRLAAAADAADPQVDADPRCIATESALAAPLRRLGYRTLTVTAGAAPGAASDAAPADTRLVERAARLVAGLVRQIDAEP
ncbi:MAG: hypothetical protein RMK84_18305 [Oscillochloridaceae bacterium]|nr:hypothetical protein [Chloroflexaceae bacterium]MDW8392078.1 hypothetical protein [Oscillochloridaceae bacterium]